MKRATLSSSPARRALQVLVWAVALTVIACDADVSFTGPDWPVGPVRLSMISGNNQAGAVRQPLGAPFVVQVVDERGEPVSGAVVLWDIVEGGGDLPAVPKGPQKLLHETKTDASGFVRVVLTLGPQPGQNVVESKLLFGAGSTTFVATGMAGG